MGGKQEILTWEQVQDGAIALSGRLAGKGPFKGVVAVARGGLIPAAIIAHRLDLRLVDAVSVSTYDGRLGGGSHLLKSVEGDGEGWLIIDDLVDSGKTFRLLRRFLPKATYAAIYAKPAGKDSADVTEVDVDQECWIVFPWEND